MSAALATLSKVVATIDDLRARLDRIEKAPLPLWMQQRGPQGPASASTTPGAMSIAPPLSKAAYGSLLSLGAGSADAVLNALLSDPATAGAVRMKIEQMRSLP